MQEPAQPHGTSLDRRNQDSVVNRDKAHGEMKSRVESERRDETNRSRAKAAPSTVTTADNDFADLLADDSSRANNRSKK